AVHRAPATGSAEAALRAASLTADVERTIFLAAVLILGILIAHRLALVGFLGFLGPANRAAAVLGACPRAAAGTGAGNRAAAFRIHVGESLRDGLGVFLHAAADRLSVNVGFAGIALVVA